MASSTPAQVPPVPFVYRLWFLYIDPVLSLGGVYGGFFAPDQTLQSFIPATIPSPGPGPGPGGGLVPNPDAFANPAHLPVFHQLGAWSVLTFVLGGLMQRRTRDLAVWRFYQGSIAVVDAVIVGSTLRAYAAQGRLHPRAWAAVDWVCVGVTAACGLLRAAFLLGVGMGGEAKKQRKRS